MANVVNDQRHEQHQPGLRTAVVRGQPRNVPDPTESKGSTITGKRLKEARLAIKDKRGKPLGVRELARRSTVDAGVISRIENGETQHAEGETVRKLALALGVNTDWLLGSDVPSASARSLAPSTGDPATDSPSPPPTSDTHTRTDIVLDEPPSNEQLRRFGDLPGWAEAEAEARRMFEDVPDFAFARARSTSGAVLPESVTPELVAKWAMIWFEQATADERKQAERAEVRAALARYREQQKKGA